MIPRSAPLPQTPDEARVRALRPRISHLALVALLAAFAAACDEDASGTGGPEVDGVWQGKADLAGDTFTFALELAETDDDVEGSGSVAAESGTLDLAVEGEAPFPAFGLTLTSPGYTPLRLTGTYKRGSTTAADSLDGTLNGSGFPGTRLVLLRRP